MFHRHSSEEVDAPISPTQVPLIESKKPIEQQSDESILQMKKKIELLEARIDTLSQNIDSSRPKTSLISNVSTSQDLSLFEKGETCLLQGDLKGAKDYFHQILDQPIHKEWEAPALLRLSQIATAMNDPVDEKNYLQKLYREYPEHPCLDWPEPGFLKKNSSDQKETVTQKNIPQELAPNRSKEVMEPQSP